MPRAWQSLRGIDYVNGQILHALVSAQPQVLLSDLAASIHIKVGWAGSSQSLCWPLRWAWTAACQPTIVIIWLKLLSSLFTIILSKWSTEGKLYHVPFSAFDSVNHDCSCPSSGTTSLSLVPPWPGSSHTFPVERRLLCLEMIEVALLLLVVVYHRAQYLAWWSLSLTPKMSWNFAIAVVWVIIFLPMTRWWCRS